MEGSHFDLEVKKKRRQDSQNAYGDKTTRICIGNDTKEWLAAFVKTHNLKSNDEGLQELLKLHPKAPARPRRGEQRAGGQQQLQLMSPQHGQQGVMHGPAFPPHMEDAKTASSDEVCRRAGRRVWHLGDLILSLLK